MDSKSVHFSVSIRQLKEGVGFDQSYSSFGEGAVAFLALGLRPRQGVARLWAKREARESCRMLPGVQESVKE